MKLKERWRIEVRHFGELSSDLKRLLVAYGLYLVAYPLTMTFTNAYLWRDSQDLMAIVIYNMMFCLGLPVGFYLNGWLLKYWHVLRLYWVGSVMQGLGSLLVVFSGEINVWKLVIFGMIYGVGAGIFWGNKNYLSLRLTVGPKRLYFNSLESVTDTVINIAVPAVIGLVIVAGVKSGGTGVETAYQWLMTIGVGLLAVSGWVMQGAKLKDIEREPMLVKQSNKSWNLARLYHYLISVMVGIEFVLPSVLVLKMVGDEGVLGILGSITALLSVVVLYWVGRKGKPAEVWKVVLLTGVGLVAITGNIAWKFSPWSVVVYMLISTPLWSLMWTTGGTLIMEVMDRMVKPGEGQYAFICDNELFYNLGRVVGMVMLVGLWMIDEEMSLRYMLLFGALLQLVGVWPLRKLGQWLGERSTY